MGTKLLIFYKIEIGFYYLYQMAFRINITAEELRTIPEYIIDDIKHRLVSEQRPFLKARIPFKKGPTRILCSMNGTPRPYCWDCMCMYSEITIKDSAGEQVPVSLCNKCEEYFPSLRL